MTTKPMSRVAGPNQPCPFKQQYFPKVGSTFVLFTHPLGFPIPYLFFRSSTEIQSPGSLIFFYIACAKFFSYFAFPQSCIIDLYICRSLHPMGSGFARAATLLFSGCRSRNPHEHSRHLLDSYPKETRSILEFISIVIQKLKRNVKASIVDP